MGFHTFKCENCGEIELNISSKLIPLKICPLCQGTKIEKAFFANNDIWMVNGAFSKINHKE